MPKVICYKCDQPFEPAPETLKSLAETNRSVAYWECPTCAGHTRQVSVHEAVSLVPAHERTYVVRKSGRSRIIENWSRGSIVNVVSERCLEHGAELTDGFLVVNDLDSWLFIRTQEAIHA